MSQTHTPAVQTPFSEQPRSVEQLASDNVGVDAKAKAKSVTAATETAVSRGKVMAKVVV